MLADGPTLIERVAQVFALGRPVAEPARVPGGLSNEMWRLVTPSGDFAVKRMIVNADQPGFAANVEAAFHVEHHACAAGVPMPEPIPAPSTERALAEVDGSLFRVHRWVDGRPGVGSATDAAELLARIHAAGRSRWEPPPATGWTADRWGADLVALTQRVRPGPDRLMVVDSHRDLDRKNTLLTPDGALLAVDWDAAGPVGAAHEIAGLALDWTDGDPSRFADAVQAYRERGGVPVDPEPWIFAGWVAAQGGWLDHNATHRGDSPLGRAEVTGALTRLQALATELDTLLDALRTIG